jgi:3-hydroxyisobutyrate dehydrogenase-like beta-hydroxyacid dehydrogenase
MKVGFIGLGHMGAGMAANLLKAGHDVTVYNRTRTRVEALVAQGAKAAASVSDACRGDAVLTMLADDRAVESIVFSGSGIIDSLPAGAIHISSSTISVVLSERLEAAHAKAGQLFVAAPVIGRPDAAAAGQLYVVAAGAPDAVKAAASLFDAIGQKTFVVSETPKDGNLVKLSGNFLIASVIESVGEAMALIGKAGIGPEAISRHPDLDAFRCLRLQDLWWADRRWKIRTSRFCSTAWPERHPPDARGSGRSPRAHAARESPARPVPDIAGPWRRQARLVRNRSACGQGRWRGGKLRATTLWLAPPRILLTMQLVTIASDNPK